MSGRVEEVRDYGFADQALALRKRAGLTQRELAALLRVSVQSIQAWEAGLSYPASERLTELIALYLERGALLAGREEEEAAALWAAVRAKAARRTAPFDPTWFATLRRAPESVVPAPALSPAPRADARRHDWGDAPASPVVQGRAQELATLARWVTEERRRLVQVLGVGGIGKTTVAAQLAYELAPTFAVVFWRSLRDGLPVEEWLAGAIAVLSGGHAVPSEAFAARLVLLLELLRARRALLVLDNLETILEPGAPEARYRPGYEGYREVLRQVAGSQHQSCLLLTSREQPLHGNEVTACLLRLKGLEVEAGRMLLSSRDLVGDLATWRTLVLRYSGNPLALGLVGETIRRVFGGDLAAFLAQDVAVIGGIRQLLEEQIARLSPLERAICDCLAVEREPLGFTILVAHLGQGVERVAAVDAVEALQRRSLLQQGAGGTFTLQPVVLEYCTSRLVEACARELVAGTPRLLVSWPLLKATAKDYVRRGQERLIVQPLLDRLHSTLGSEAAVEQRLLAVLDAWRGRPAPEQGYGPGNVVNLLRLQRGHVRGLDCSHLVIRHAYLQGVEAQDAKLVDAHLAEAVLAEAFHPPAAVALSTDGALLAVGTATGEVCVWQVATRTLLVALQGHTAAVLAVALGNEGRLLASGSFDGTIKLWEPSSGQFLASLRGHTAGVISVALSSDGRLLASGSQDQTIRLWAVERGQLLATLEGHTGWVWGVAVSADGRLLASGGQDGTVKLWETATGRLLATLRGHAGLVYDVALRGDGGLVASGSEDGTVKLWETATGHLLATLEGHTGGVWSVTVSGDGRLIASGGQDGTVKLWETETGRLLTTLRGHAGLVYDVALLGDGGLVASGSEDGTVKVWEGVPAIGSPGGLLATLQGHFNGIWGMAMTGDGRLLACGCQDRSVRLWHLETGRLLATLQGHTGLVYAVALSGDGRLLASAGQDGTVRLWDARRGRSLASLEGHISGVRGVALSEDGHFVASAGYDGTVKIWEPGSGQLPRTLEGHTGGVWAVALSLDGRLAASAGQDETVRLWETETGRLLTTLHGQTSAVWGVALSADGRLVASGSEGGTVMVWEVASRRLLAHVQQSIRPIFNVALSGDGQVVAGASYEGTVTLWETATGRLLNTLDGQRGVIYGLAMSADGQLVAGGSAEGTVTLWTLPGGQDGDVRPRTLRADRPYERMDISGLSGVTEAQRAALVALGAVEQGATEDARQTSAGAAAGLVRTQVPQVATVAPPARPRTNLPPARTTFIGRSADLAALAAALDPTTRTGACLLTMSGTAGSGKTRLAHQVAETLLDAYSDGVWLVELAPLLASTAADPTTVVAAMLSTLGLQEQPGQTPLDTLMAYVQSKHLLLVLDNCEHVAAACAALVARLLATCPKLRILTTSQQALGHADETIWPVTMLAVPPLIEGTPTPDAIALLAGTEAVQLFVERARAVQPGFVLSAANAAGVAAICRRLDGLPLAIELAAARLYVLPVEEVLTRLDDRFRLLRRGGRIASDRHQTLQATLDWSYGLLEPAEQTLLRRVAVFSGGWEVGAAEVVCAGGAVAANAVLELLDELLERSLLYVYEAGGPPRYGMLETVRLYGLQQLERAGETATAREQHLRWCVALVEEVAPILRQPRQMARLWREHDNLRAALQWALDRGASTSGLRVAGGLGRFWLRGGHQREGQWWLEALLALPADDDDDASAARATALEAAAWLADDRHDFAQATALFAQAGALRRDLGGEQQPGWPLVTAAMAARAEGDYPRATVLLEENLAEYRGLGHRDGNAGGSPVLSLSWRFRYTQLALVLREQGEYARASALYEECLTLAKERGDAEDRAIALLGLGDIARDQGDATRVRAYCEEAGALFRALGQQWAVGFLLNNLALAAYLDGDLALAASRAEESEAFFRDRQAGPSLAEVLVTVGRIKRAQGEAAAAREGLAESLTLAWAKGPRWVVAAALEELGMQVVRQGQAPQGVPLLAAAAALRQKMGAPIRPTERPALNLALATARTALGQPAFAGAWTMGQSLPLEQVVSQALVAPEGLFDVGELAVGR